MFRPGGKSISSIAHSVLEAYVSVSGSTFAGADMQSLGCASSTKLHSLSFSTGSVLEIVCKARAVVYLWALAWYSSVELP